MFQIDEVVEIKLWRDNFDEVYRSMKMLAPYYGKIKRFIFVINPL